MSRPPSVSHEPSRHSTTSRLVWIVVLASEIAIFYRRILFEPSRFVIPWDFRSFHLPQAAWIADAFARGEWPLWDPYTYSGRPLFAAGQAQVFYPPTLITAAVSNLFGRDHLLYLLELQALLHILFAGLCVCIFLRRIGLNPWAALIGATIFQLGPFFTSQLQHLGVVDAVAWLPAACLFAFNLGDSGSFRWVGALAFSWAMSLLAGLTLGAPPVVIAALLIAVAAGWNRPLRTALRLAAALALAAAIACIQLIPTAQLANLSVARFRLDWMGDGGGIPLQAFVSVIIPDFYHIFELDRYKLAWNPTFLYLYCGIPTLLLVLYALIARKRPPTNFAVFAAIFAILMTGSSTSAGRLFMPAFLKITDYSVYVEFLMAGFVFGIACLAALGSASLFKSPWQYWLVLIVITADLVHAGSGRVFNTVSTRGDPGVSRDQFDGSTELLSRIRSELNGAVPPYRIDTVDDSLAWATAGPLLRIPTSTGDDPLALSAYMRIRSLFAKDVTRWGRYYQVAFPDSRWLDFLNVRVLSSRTPIDDSGHWRKLTDFPGRMLYVNDRVLPRFFFVREVQAAASADQAFELMRSAEFDPGRMAVVEAPTRPSSCRGGEVAVRSYAPNGLALETSAPDDCLMVSSEVYYPGWHAWLDEQPIQITRVNSCFRGLVVPKGRHRVTMRFQPEGLLVRGLSSVLSLLAALAFWWQPKRYSRTKT